MSEVKFRELRNSPPMVINFAKAVLRATVKPGSNPTLPDVGLRLNDVSLDEKHLTAYRKVCGFAADGKLPVTYPHMHAFPLHMALILTDGFPFPAMGLVHVRNSITQYRPIAEREQLNVKCFLGNLQKVDKGYEFSIFTSVSTGGERVWESESVNFFRSGGGSSSKKKDAPKPQPATDTVEWKVPGDIGRRYGAVTACITGRGAQAPCRVQSADASRMPWRSPRPSQLPVSRMPMLWELWSSFRDECVPPVCQQGGC